MYHVGFGECVITLNLENLPSLARVLSDIREDSFPPVYLRINTRPSSITFRNGQFFLLLDP